MIIIVRLPLWKYILMHQWLLQTHQNLDPISHTHVSGMCQNPTVVFLVYRKHGRHREVPEERRLVHVGADEEGNHHASRVSVPRGLLAGADGECLSLEAYWPGLMVSVRP